MVTHRMRVDSTSYRQLRGRDLARLLPEDVEEHDQAGGASVEDSVQL